MIKRKRRRSLLSARIKQGRERLNLTLEEFGAKCDADKSQVWHWEHGSYAPSARILPKVAAVLGITTDELLAEAA